MGKITTGWRTFGDYERKVDWTAGYDCRTTCEHPEHPGDHGICDDELRFILRRRSQPREAVSLGAFTNTTRRRVVSTLPDRRAIRGTCVGLHVAYPVTDEQVRSGDGGQGECDCLPSGKCYEGGMHYNAADAMFTDADRAVLGPAAQDTNTQEVAIGLTTGLWERLQAWHDEHVSLLATAASVLPARCPACDGKGLVPFCTKDPSHADVNALWKALALAKSMIRCGEAMSPFAEQAFRDAFDANDRFQQALQDVDFMVKQAGEVNKALASCHVVSGVQGVQALREHLDDALEALIWCSGSDDFTPGGKARAGWEKGPAKTIERLLGVTGRSKT